MGFDGDELRRVMRHWATGVTIVTTRHNGQPHAMTANAVTSLSLDPPLILVAVDRQNTMHGMLKLSECFAVNVLRADQEDLSNRFATPGAKEYDDLELVTAETGSPILSGSLAFVDCRVTDVLPGGDHDIFVGRIVAGDVGEGTPLIYYSGEYKQLAT